MRQRGNDPELREFLLMLRRALLMVCRYIEKKYGLETADASSSEALAKLN